MLFTSPSPELSIISRVARDLRSTATKWVLMEASGLDARTEAGAQ